MFRILPICVALFVAICLFPTDESLPADGNSCFFVDGVPLCGREGEEAREKHRKMIENLIVKQQDQHLRADPDELPQSDDPRFESRVAYTGQANTNNKGQSTPVKGEPRPLPTTTTPPCPPTTTTPPPCPLMTTTTTTTTPKPLSPCEKYKLEQEKMRNNPYVMMADQPALDIDNMMADQPVPEAVMSEEQSFIQAVNFEEQSAPAVSQQYAPSQYAQLGQFRGELASPTTQMPPSEVSTSGNSLMESLLPQAIRGANRGRLSLSDTNWQQSWLQKIKQNWS